MGDGYNMRVAARIMRMAKKLYSITERDIMVKLLDGTEQEFKRYTVYTDWSPNYRAVKTPVKPAPDGEERK